MKKSVIFLSALLSFSAMAAGPQLDNLSKDDVEDLSQEFGGNFAHTVVAAPETSGLFGIEVGVVAGQTSAPKFKDLIEENGGKGSDFESLYYAGLAARAHFPLELFVEASILPEQEISDITISNTSYGVGWNFGGFFNFPLDLAVGVNRAGSEISFKQTTPVNATVNLETTTTNYWIGASKSFFLFTPYFKVGTSSIDGDLKATADIFEGVKTSQSVETTGGYFALGTHINLLILKLGLEYSQVQDVKRVAGKLSFSF